MKAGAAGRAAVHHGVDQNALTLVVDPLAEVAVERLSRYSEPAAVRLLAGAFGLNPGGRGQHRSEHETERKRAPRGAPVMRTHVLPPVLVFRDEYGSLWAIRTHEERRGSLQSTAVRLDSTSD